MTAVSFVLEIPMPAYAAGNSASLVGTRVETQQPAITS